MTPIQASVKKNEGDVYNNSLDKRKKTEPKFQVNNIVGTADLKKIQKRCSRKEIRPISLISFIKLQKELIIQYQVIKSTI